MCGFAGFVGQFDGSHLMKMGVEVAHRGPDDSAELLLETKHGRVGLVHRRLAIIDLSSAGRQPMTVNCQKCGCEERAPQAQRLWLAYNGEVYNFQALREELVGRGHHFQSQTDSEVLIHLYAEFGIGMLKRLNGIFALAIYDGRPSGQPEGFAPGDVLLARDGVGVKPLYYAETPQGVVFGSELKAFLHVQTLDRSLDPESLESYLTYLWAPSPRTPIKGVLKVDPGQWLKLRGGKICNRGYFYDLPYGREPFHASEEDLVERLREVLASAVQRQMVSDVPVGAFLSGGLDSSAVVAMMKKSGMQERIRCYSIGFRDSVDAEGNALDLPYAKKVAKHLGVDLVQIHVDAEMISNLETVLYHLDEPQADPAPINAYLIARRAREDGIKVLMSGAGGDDLFSGYRRHWALTREPLWSWLPGSIRGLMGRTARGVQNGSTGAAGKTWARRMAKMFAHADRSADRRLVSYFHWNSSELRESLRGPLLQHGIHAETADQPLLETLSRIPGENSPLNRMLYLEGKHFLADHNLNYTDKVSMAAGVETRVPLLDLEVVDFATRIPPGLKQKGRIGKFLFKRAMEPYLPHDVIYRPKTGFGAPLRYWLNNQLKEVSREVLSRQSLLNRGLFDPRGVERLIQLTNQQRVDGAYTIFSLMCIELWCRIFIDGKGLNSMGKA